MEIFVAGFISSF